MRTQPTGLLSLWQAVEKLLVIPGPAEGRNPESRTPAFQYQSDGGMDSGQPHAKRRIPGKLGTGAAFGMTQESFRATY
jgi:hypothetical protein